MRNTFPTLNVYEKNTLSSKVSTQLLYGDTFKKLKRKGTWIKIKSDKDNYRGYIKNRKFQSNQKNTHKVCDIFANLYSLPQKKYKLEKKLSFGSRVKITQREKNYYKFDIFWIKKKSLEKINLINKNPFKKIKKFTNIRYKWGGKSFSGIDCSALVQVFLNYNNRFCPRDAKDQMKYFKKTIKLKNIRKNDLIFWKGHVAIVLSKKKLIHAYGPFKKVVIMSVKKTIDRIRTTAKLKVIGIKRI